MSRITANIANDGSCFVMEKLSHSPVVLLSKEFSTSSLSSSTNVTLIGSTSLTNACPLPSSASVSNASYFLFVTSDGTVILACFDEELNLTKHYTLAKALDIPVTPALRSISVRFERVVANDAGSDRVFFFKAVVVFATTQSKVSASSQAFLLSFQLGEAKGAFFAVVGRSIISRLALPDDCSSTLESIHLTSPPSTLPPLHSSMSCICFTRRSESASDSLLFPASIVVTTDSCRLVPESAFALSLKSVSSHQSFFALDHLQFQHASSSSSTGTSRRNSVTSARGNKMNNPQQLPHQHRTSNVTESSAVLVPLVTVLTNPFLLSVYDVHCESSALLGTIPLPVRYRNASSLHSSLKRRGDEQGSTLKPIFYKTLPSSSRLVLFVAVVYEDFQSCSVLSFSLRSKPEMLSTSSIIAYYVDTKGVWNLNLASPSEVFRLFNDDDDKLFVCDDKYNTTGSTSTRQTRISKFLEESLSFSLPTDDLLKVELTNNNKSSSSTYLQLFELSAQTSVNEDDDGKTKNQSAMTPKYFGKKVRVTKTPASSANNKPQLEQTQLEEYTLTTTSNLSSLSQNRILHARGPARSLFEERKLLCDFGEKIFLSFHHDLLEFSCWREQKMEQVGNNKSENFTFTLHQEELARLELSSSSSSAKTEEKACTMATNHSIRSVKSNDDEKKEIFKNSKNNVLSACYVVDERFVVVVMFHREKLGAQIALLHSSSQSDDIHVSVDESSLESDVTRLHPFKVVVPLVEKKN